jgi:hypothetical protein
MKEMKNVDENEDNNIFNKSVFSEGPSGRKKRFGNRFDHCGSQ